MMQLPPCPKCKGHLYLDSDHYGEYISCRHCGWSKDINVGPALPKSRDDRIDEPVFEDGCNISPTCFACPLPDCLYESPIARKSLLRDQAVLAEVDKHQGLGVAQAVLKTSQLFGLTERSVYRALQRRQQQSAA
jgi:DNA-directed RNA polymerase subunit M/transcription elongation factor TFIIS